MKRGNTVKTIAEGQILSCRRFGLLVSLSLFTATGCMALPPSGTQGSASWLPRWFQTAEAQDTSRPVQAVTTEQRPAATFIVRFNDEPVLAEIGKTYRRDGDGARAKFERWCTEHAELDGLTLVRASYSGELVIGLPHDDPLNRTPADVLAALNAMDNLAYAELDAIAHPGAKE